MRPQNNRGFTLVELGIVVTVFIVLATTLYMCTGNSDSDVSENNAPQDCQIGNECLTKGSWYGNKGDLSRAGMFYGRACEFKKGAGCNKLGLLVEEGAGGYQQSILRKPVITAKPMAAVIWAVFMKTAGAAFRIIPGQRSFTIKPVS